MGTIRDNCVSLSIVSRRIEAEYVLSPKGENPQPKYLRNDDHEVTGATLQYRGATDLLSPHRNEGRNGARAVERRRAGHKRSTALVSNKLPSR